MNEYERVPPEIVRIIRSEAPQWGGLARPSDLNTNPIDNRKLSHPERPPLPDSRQKKTSP